MKHLSSPQWLAPIEDLRNLETAPARIGVRHAHVAAVGTLSMLSLADAMHDPMAHAFGSVIDGLKVPVFLVRPSLLIVHQNAMASRLLGEFSTLRGAGGNLQFPGETIPGQVKAAVEAATQDSEALMQGAGMLFRPTGRKSLIVHVLPLKRRSVWPEPAAVAALFVIDPAAPIDYSLDTVKLLYGLRPAEVRVLDLTLRGLTGPQIAGELSIAPSTVKTHMLALFEKFGVGNKVRLVSAVFAATQTVLS